MNIRAAMIADKPALIELINDAFQVTDYFKYDKRVNNEEMDRYFLNGHFVVLEIENKPAACVYYTLRPGLLNFGLLSVASSCQGKGLSKMMISHVEEIAAAANCHAIQIEVVNIRTLLFPFYEKMGYVPAGTMPFRKPTRVPCHLVIMKKEIG